MEQMLAGLEEHPQREVTLASPGFLTEATVFTLTDGSMIMVDWPGENPGAFCLHRFTGGIPQDQQCWLDWGYNPPVASARRPLPGNERPQTESLEIR